MAEKEEIKQLTAEEIEAAERLQKELSEMSGTKRAAVLMLLLGEQQAAEIIRFLNPKEVQALGGAMVSVADLSQEAVNVVLDEFVITLKKQTSLGLGTGGPWNLRGLDGRPGTARFDAALTDRGYLAMGGQIIDATVVPAPKQRNSDEEKAAIKQGKVPERWKERPAKVRQKDRDARWTVKYSKAKVKEGGDPKGFKPVDLAIPMFGYKNHIGIDRAHGLIRTWDASAANAHDGARLPELISKQNTGSGVWADTAYRSKKNEAFLERGMFKSNIHQRRMPRRPMPEHIARANAKRSAVRSAVEHVFAGQKHRMGLFIRSIGIARAKIKIGMANLAYNFQRLAWLEGRSAPA